MARVYRETRQRTIEDERVPARDDNVVTTDGAITAARVIYLIGGAIMMLLGLRFLLSLMGANHGNAFAALIYNLSYPFVAPFFGLFNYRMQYGVSRIEFETLVAIIVYGLITYFLVRLVTVGSRTHTDTSL